MSDDFTPITVEQARLLQAWEGELVDGVPTSDRDTLERHGWLTDTDTLTVEATRLLLDAWDIEDTQSA